MIFCAQAKNWKNSKPEICHGVITHQAWLRKHDQLEVNFPEFIARINENNIE